MCRGWFRVTVSAIYDNFGTKPAQTDNLENQTGNWGLIGLTGEGYSRAGFDGNIRAQWSKFSLNPPLR